MKNSLRLVTIILFLIPLRLFGQTNPAHVPSQLSTQPAAVKGSTEDSQAEDEKPFKPHWENEFELSFSNQQAGQSSSSLAYTGTYHFDEDGSFLSGELELTKQKVEGVGSGTGTLTATGGVGIGIFTPSLALGAELGESAVRQYNGDLSLAFQFWEPFSVTLSLGGNGGSHTGDISSVSPIYAPYAGIPVRIDTAGLNSSLAFTFAPWDWWTISLTPGTEYDLTYAWQTLGRLSLRVPVDQGDLITSLTLGLDFTLFKGFVLDLSPQVGQEYYPAGLAYSRNAGGLVYSNSPHTDNFAGSTLSVSYSFE